MKGLFEETRGRLHEMGTATGECMNLLQKAFIRNSPGPADECREKLSAIRRSEEELQKHIAKLAKADEKNRVYATVLQHILRICDHLDDLAATLLGKIKGNVLFSDRAVTEISFLSQHLRDILRTTGDIVLVKNPILIRYVLESETMVVKMTIDYATHHEERLVEGLCHTEASPLFLKILDDFKGIAWEAKEIAKGMAEE